MYYVYIIYSDIADKYYVGHTNDVNKRLIQHNEGLSQYTSAYIPWQLAWSVETITRSEAIILEKKLKNLSGTRLVEFIKKYS